VHEFTVVRSLLEQVDRIVAEQGGGDIEEIRIRCGDFSGVEPNLVAEAFELLRVGSRWQETRLRVEVEPLIARCESCGTTFEPDRFRFRCPACGAPTVREVSGDRVILESITLRTADRPPQQESH